ncbi:MAG: RNA methyltransferase [Candidatus Bathyarchaeia archaeon]
MPLKQRFSIAIPASLVSDIPHLREKTSRIGLIGRAAAIFRIDEIIVFPDMPKTDQRRDMELIFTILSYLETPQYLRKKLFGLKPELRYVGVLPPLRTPHHPLSNKTENLKIGEHREGVVVSKNKNGSFVDVGVEKALFLPNIQLLPKTRVTVKIVKLGKSPELALADVNEIEDYWGFHITVSNMTLAQLLKERKFHLTIATSRRGAPFTHVMENLKQRLQNSKNVLIIFGAPTMGLYEIVAQNGLKLEDIVDFVVNTIPCQGTETVRTEEAVFASLALLNFLIKG